MCRRLRTSDRAVRLGLHARGAEPSTTGAAVGDGSRSFDAKTSKRVSGTPTTTLYQNVDGTYTRIAYPGPVNYQTSNGAWAGIDTSLARGADGRLHEKANSLAVDFAASARDTHAIGLVD